MPWLQALVVEPLKNDSLRVKLPVGEETIRSLTKEQWVLPLGQDQVPLLEQWVSEAVFIQALGTSWEPADKAGPKGLI